MSSEELEASAPLAEGGRCSWRTRQLGAHPTGNLRLVVSSAQQSLRGASRESLSDECHINHADCLKIHRFTSAAESLKLARKALLCPTPPRAPFHAKSHEGARAPAPTVRADPQAKP